MTHIGQYGGQYVPETLMPTLAEIDAAFRAALDDPDFQAEYQALLRDYVGRETPLYEARRLSDALGGARIFLKREDLNHTGAHKVNNVLGQALLARRMGKTRLIAETGAGMHGVATATAAMNEAIRDWAASAEHTFYVIGTVAGPAPYPEMVKAFQAVIGREARRQCLDKIGRLPDEVIACVGGGSNAMGIFAGFLGDPGVHLTGVEAAGEGLSTGRHAASINGGTVGVLHGAKTKLLQTPGGQIIEAYSVSAGLDYPGVGPEHCHLAALGRARYAVCDDRHAIHAFDALCRCEGIIPALESSHALAEAIRIPSSSSTSPAVATRTWTMSHNGRPPTRTTATKGLTPPTAARPRGLVRSQSPWKPNLRLPFTALRRAEPASSRFSPMPRLRAARHAFSTCPAGSPRWRRPSPRWRR